MVQVIKVSIYPSICWDESSQLQKQGYWKNKTFFGVESFEKMISENKLNLKIPSLQKSIMNLPFALLPSPFTSKYWLPWKKLRYPNLLVNFQDLLNESVNIDIYWGFSNYRYLLGSIDTYWKSKLYHNIPISIPFIPIYTYIYLH